MGKVQRNLLIAKNHSLIESISFFSRNTNRDVLCINEDLEVDGSLLVVSKVCSNIEQARKFYKDNPCFDDHKGTLSFEEFLVKRKSRNLPKLEY